MGFNIRDGQSEISGDFSKLEKLIKNLGEKHFVDVGVFASAKAPDGTQVAEYGAYNEFGSLSVPNRPPKRSFIRMPLEVKQGEIAEYVEKKARAHVESGDIKAIFEDIGVAAEAKIQEAFDSDGWGAWPPDADSTVARKGSSTPLIDTGLLRKSITHRTDGK